VPHERIRAVAGSIYFIHSDYSHEDGVRKEKIENSFALKNSTQFWLGNFSHQKNIEKIYNKKWEIKKI
jgi:hypothetical protein